MHRCDVSNTALQETAELLNGLETSPYMCLPQDDRVDAPVPLVDFPLGHRSQYDAPVLELYLPFMQLVQDFEPSRNAEVPVGHLEQVVLPLPEELLPLRHLLQGDSPLAENEPAWQWYFTDALLEPSVSPKVWNSLLIPERNSVLDKL